MKLILFVFLPLLCALSQARHIHPSDHPDYIPGEIYLDEVNNVESDQPIDILSMKPTRFVPFNSVLFFKTYEPCEDGFKRDVLGICREVWD